MALSSQDVQTMLDSLEQTLSSHMSTFLVSEGQPVKDPINAHNAVIIDHAQRMTSLVDVFNQTTGETIAEVKRQREVLGQQQGQASVALNETQMLDVRFKELTQNMNNTPMAAMSLSSSCSASRPSSGPMLSSSSTS